MEEAGNMVSIEHIYSRFNESTGITTDTRQCREGMMFVALRGEMPMPEWWWDSRSPYAPGPSAWPR